MKHIATTFSLLLSVAAAATAQTSTEHYRPGVSADGVVYFLPKTAVNVHVQVEKTTYQPGDFAPYAQRYLRLNDVQLKPSVAYRVVGIQTTPAGIADSTKAVVVKLNAKTSAPNVALSDDGCLLAINADAKQPQARTPFQPAPKPTPVNPRQYMNEEILAAGSTAKMAQLTAREIYDLRENRNLLIKGQADFMPQDGNQMQLMLNRLDTQDRALSQLFQGSVTRDTTEHTVTIVPDGPLNRQPIFRLSQTHGFTDTDDLSGTPYYISVENLLATPAATVQDNGKKKKEENGVFVNVPGKMRVTVFDGVKKVSEADFPAGQFGNVELLSADLFNKRFTTHVWLNPVTGAVDKLEAEQPK